MNGVSSELGNRIYNAFIVFTAFTCGCCHYYHVSTMFENDRHFSHLSNLEREMTFRTEMGLYYSYFKRIVQAPTFLSGLSHIMHDNLTEYPSTINTLQRFNLYPEVFLSAAYRTYVNAANTFGFKTKDCWQVDRGSELPTVWSCEGLGDPPYFYLNGVWFCAGLTAALLFFFGFFLSKSVLGGFIAILSFFFNHGECTRVQWTPPLRESFAYPLILGQMLAVSWCLRQTLPHWKHLVLVAAASSACLVTWQFSQFVFLTQVAALMILWLQNQNARPIIVVILIGKLVGLQNAVLLLFANEMLLTSFYSCAMIATLGTILFLPSALKNEAGSSLRSVLTFAMIIGVGTLMLRFTLSYLLVSRDDAHIFNLLRAKLTSYTDFHTMLYICAAEFDFISASTLYQLTKTLLLPTVYIALGLVVLYAVGFLDSQQATDKRQQVSTWKKNRSSRRDKDVETYAQRTVDLAVMYNVLQLAAFVIMAVFIMRLKLFMSPHLCITAGLLASRKYMVFIKSQLMHWALVAVLISAMSVAGLNNLMLQRSIIGEYNNPALEELINWIDRETPKEAAFAGPMPIMASILLTTQRPIVNHPHYEDSNLRERTKKVYRAFGRGTVTELYRTMVELKVTYLVIQEMWCYGQPRPGCSMLDIWDTVEPHRKDRSPLCPILFEGNTSPLQRVFVNEVYVVLRVPSRYVEVTLPRQYRQ